jgi:hypothetical protein
MGQPESGCLMQGLIKACVSVPEDQDGHAVSLSFSPRPLEVVVSLTSTRLPLGFDPLPLLESFKDDIWWELTTTEWLRCPWRL